MKGLAIRAVFGYSSREYTKLLMEDFAGPTWPSGAPLNKEPKPNPKSVQDMVAVVKDPSLVSYEPRTSLSRIQSAFEKRPGSLSMTS